MKWQEKFNSNLSKFKHGNRMQICSLLSCDLWKSLGRCYSEKWTDGQTAWQQTRIEQDWAMTLASPFSLQVEECVCWANCSWKIELSFHSEHPRLADHKHTHTPQLILWQAFWTQIVQEDDCMVHTVQLHNHTKHSVQIKKPASIPV